MSEFAYAYTVYESPYSERDIAEALGIDYDDILKARAERETWEPEVREAFDELQRRTQRTMLGL